MQTAFPGLHAMQNVHPLFVHFPIALWIAALSFEVVSLVRSSDEWHRTAARLLYLGTLFGLAAAATGWLAQRSVSPTGDAHDVMELHETLMLFALSLAGWLSLLAFLCGVALCVGGGVAFLYAHVHDPKPDADPNAVRLLSHADYNLLHYGSVALMAVGVLLVLWAMFRLRDAH